MSDISKDQIPTTSPIDSQALTDIYPDDESKRIKVMIRFGPQLKQLEQDVQSALAINNHKQGRFFAHKLRSSSKSIGAMALSELCLKIEMAAKDNSNDLSQFQKLLTQRSTEVLDYIRQLT